MVHHTSEIVWMPVIHRQSVAVVLNDRFARLCAAHKLDKAIRQRIAKRAWQNIGRKGLVPSNFLDFHGTLLLHGVYLGMNGVWLALGSRSPNIDRALTYSGHNEDRFSADRLDLLQAFGEWAKAASLILDWK